MYNRIDFLQEGGKRMDLMNVNDALNQYKASPPTFNQRVYKTLLTDTSNSILDNWSAAKTSTKANAVSFSITQEAQNAGNIYNQLKQNGSKDAMDGFQKSFVNYAKNGNMSGLSNLVSAGMKMNEQKTFSDYSNMLAASNKISNQLNQPAANQFINESISTYSQLGVSAMNSYVKAANSINSNFNSSTQEGLNSKISAMSNLNNLWKTMREQNASPEQITSQMAEAANNVSQKTNFSELNNYLNNLSNKLKGNMSAGNL